MHSLTEIHVHLKESPAVHSSGLFITGTHTRLSLSSPRMADGKGKTGSSAEFTANESLLSLNLTALLSQWTQAGRRRIEIV